MGNVDLATIDHSCICQLSVELSTTLMVCPKTTTAHIMQVQTVGHMTLVYTGTRIMVNIILYAVSAITHYVYR